MPPQRRLEVVISGDSRGAQRAMRQADQSTGKFAGTVGKATKALGAMGAVAIAGVAVKTGRMAIEFEASMSKITGLVGIARDEVDKMGDSVLSLAGAETGQGAQDLADALFFITSGGLRGAAAMDALESAGKAASAGLGNLDAVAQGVTAAMNAYGPEVLGAAEATDVMVATVRAGNLEAGSLAGVFSQLLPLSSELDVKFSDIGGALAVLSKTGANASEAATGVKGIMRTLIKPTEGAKTALEGVGVSMDDIGEVLEERGLVGTLRFLEEAFDGNARALSQVFTDSEGLTAALSILGQEAAGVDQIMRDVSRSAGITDEAYKEWAETTEGRLTIAMEELDAVLTRLGAATIPFLADAASGLTVLFEGLSAAGGDFLDIGGGLGSIASGLGAVVTDPVGSAGRVGRSIFGGGSPPVPPGQSGRGAPGESRRHGGPFRSGQRLLVGEAGPEVVQFGRGGFVTPNDMAGGGTTVNVNVSAGVVAGADGMAELARMIRVEIQRHERRNAGTFTTAVA